MKTAWQLIIPNECLTTARHLHDEFWRLHDDCLMTAQHLPDSCLPTAWHLADDSLTTILLGLDDYMKTARRLPENCLMTTSCLANDCLKTILRAVATSYQHYFNGLCQRWWNTGPLFGLFQSSQLCFYHSQNTNSPFRWFWILTVRVCPMFFHGNWTF